MIVVHAGFTENRLILWGEKSLGEGFVPKKKPGRKPKKPRPEYYLYDPGIEKLREILELAGLDPDSEENKSIKAFVWAPSGNGKPAASSPMIDEPFEPNVEVKLKPWEITAFKLSTKGAVDFLGFCAGKPIIVPGIIPGGDAAFWANAMRFAGTIITRQQFLPDIVKQGEQYFAKWKPVFIGEDQVRLDNLVLSMPTVCRAVAANNAGETPNVPPRKILIDFISSIVDFTVRNGLSADDSQIKINLGGLRGKSFSSVHDQWLHALTASDGSIEGDSRELFELAFNIKEWQRPIDITSSAPFRLCFRLEEPAAVEMESKAAKKIDASRKTWNINYLLQARNDPSLLISASDSFNAHKRAIQNIFKRYSFNPKEYILFALGQASSICPKIEASLKTAIPDGYSTDHAGAFQFLTEKAAALQNAGFMVMLPSWWSGGDKKRQIRANAKLKKNKMVGGGKLTLDSIISVDWELALGEEKLTITELKQLAKIKTPLVRVRGKWVIIDPKEIQSAVESWKSKEDELSLRDIVRMSIGADKTPDGLEFGSVKATGWIENFFSEFHGGTTPENLATPSGFEGKLRAYQSRGFTWLQFLQKYGLGACLADDMGLGKTIEALALLQYNLETGEKKPVLLICPTSVLSNWRKETERFTPDLPVMVHHGPDRQKKKAFQKEAVKYGIVISSYALLHRDLATFKLVDWSGVILDEAQNVKNPDTKQSKAARSIKADYRIALTGTPVENNIGDLWSIMEFLNPGFLGNQATFKREFFTPIQTRNDEHAAARLKRITQPFILRRVKTDKNIIKDLPEKIEAKVFCRLTKEQASLYESIAEDTIESLQEMDGIQRKGLVLATLMKLKQVCNHPAHFLKDNSSLPDRSGKLTRLTEMLEELHETGDRALLFTQYKQMGDLLKKYLQEMLGREVPFLHGGVAKKKRDEMIDRFQSDNGLASVFILSLKAGGTGLNLTRANHVFHYDRWWNPAVENQATDRAFRIGQKRNVMVHKFICAGTLEDRIDEMIEHKQSIASQVVGTGEGWLTELSDNELRSIFTLGKEAYGD